MPLLRLENVRAFDGRRVLDSNTITFCESPGNVVSTVDGEGSELSPSDNVMDGRGCTLVPAFIDANVDIGDVDDALTDFAAFGIATVIDMSSSMAESKATRHASLAEYGLPSYFGTGTIAIPPGSGIGKIFPYRGTETIHSADDAKAFVAGIVDDFPNVTYIKVVTDPPGFDEAVLAAFVQAAHSRGKKAVAHASRVGAHARALRAGFDIISHVPVDGPLDQATAEALAAKQIVCIPTLTAMQMAVRVIQAQDPASAGGPGGVDFDHALAAVSTLRKAGVRICAGTGANRKSAETTIEFGESLHGEMELLVRAGLSNAEALQAATYHCALMLGLEDRGAVETGRRADLVLLDGNPLEDITATRRIKRLWIQGIPAKLHGFDSQD